MTHDEETDVQLHAAWCAGDRQAGGKLTKRHFPALYRFVRGRVCDPRMVEEIVGTTLLKLVECRDRLKDSTRFRAFVLGIAWNVMQAHYRRHGDDRLCFLGDEQLDLCVHSLDDLGIPPALLGDAAEQDERTLVRALHRLPIEDQQILMAFHAELMSYKEIAEAFDLKPGTTASRLHNARSRLTEAMAAVASTEAFSSTSEVFDDWARRARARAEGLGALIPHRVGHWHLVKLEPTGVDAVRGRYRKRIRRPVIELEVNPASKPERAGLPQAIRSIGDRRWTLHFDGSRKEYALQRALNNGRELYLAHRPASSWDDVIQFAENFDGALIENYA